METAARPYEISFVVRTEEDVQGISALIAEHGAQVTDEGQVKRLALAYPIKHVTEGYFGFLKVLMDPVAAKKLENAALTSSAVLRLLILTIEPEKPAKPRSTGEKDKAAPRKERPAAPAASLSNEDLQKELERLTA